MTRLRKTLFLSEMKETDHDFWDEITSHSHNKKFQAPFIFYCRTGCAKWREDLVFFDNSEVVKEQFVSNGYLIK